MKTRHLSTLLRPTLVPLLNLTQSGGTVRVKDLTLTLTLTPTPTLTLVLTLTLILTLTLTLILNLTSVLLLNSTRSGGIVR
eukprot:1340482-Amorphochlora_amoeboformis.AAC.1